MERKDTQIETLSECRFGSVVLLLRLTGIPLKIKKMSTLYSIYVITVIFCTCTTFLGMIVDVYIHRDDLRHAMTNIRALIATTNSVWMFLYCKYVTILAMTIVASRLNIKYIFRFREILAKYDKLI